ncbi:hypothetical protein Tco_0845708 [Tanacetum coccineum]
MLLAQAQEAEVALDEEQHEFLADTGERVDSAPTTSAVFMANLSTYDSDVLSEVQNYDTYQDNNVIDQSVQETQYYE